MNNHFAASWLNSLSKKLEALHESSWVTDKANGLTAHRNLFREFFSTQFQKTLGCVDAEKRVEFIRCIEKNLFKFEERTQQFPLGCLCALFEHGKDSVQTKEKVEAWLGFFLSRLKILQMQVGVDEASIKAVLMEVVDECKAPHFQRFTGVMSKQLQDCLADAIGEHLRILPEDDLKVVFEEMNFVGERVTRLVEDSIQELNDWLRTAPEFPSTPLALVDCFARLGHPLIMHYKRIKGAQTKETFLIAVALAFQTLGNKFHWMCKVEPDLVPMSLELQKTFFFRVLPGYVQPVNIMESWLPKRRETYNTDFEKHIFELDNTRIELLKNHLLPQFPPRIDGGATSWVPFYEPSALQDSILQWFSGSVKNVFCPRHTLYPKTLSMLFRRLGRMFELDMEGRKVRLSDPRSSLMPPLPPPPPAGGGVAGGTPQVVPPPLRLLPEAPQVLSVATMFGQTAPQVAAEPESAGDAPEVDNLVDFLLNEALQAVPATMRSSVQKVSHGVYRFGAKEVTFHTKNGHLFVYRVGDSVQHTPIKNFIEAELLQASEDLPALAGPAAVDKSAVEKIAAQSVQISTGAASLVTKVSPLQSNMPFGINKPVVQPEQPQDPEKLQSRRVQATTQADELNRQAVRGLFPRLNLEDESALRKLLGKGVKKDPECEGAYKVFCQWNGVVAKDPKKQSKELVASFLERHLVKYEKKDWVQKFMKGLTPEGAAKKAKKEKDKKEKKEKAKKDGKEVKTKDQPVEKKRKASQSSSSDGDDPAG
mmetsp:Transcript_30640/g.55983  ORF Transcript_30640/g.55983 Transcript_30640/m.55983 type:complete len:763 (+) Transcript_30640:106-2394(+)